MKVIVCVKQVPDTTEVKIDPEKGTLIREGVPSILNPDDANALEAALRLKDKYEDVEITVLTMGIPAATVMLRECLAMGADKAVFLTDRPFAGADTWATSNTLASAIRQMGDYDIIFAGRQAIDGDTAQVGPQIAERLGIPQVTYVMDFDCDQAAGKVTVKRQLEDGYEVIEASTPILLTAVNKLNEPRHMSVAGVMKAYETEITTWTLADLDVAADQVGRKASPTQVFRSFVPEVNKEVNMLSGSVPEMVASLMQTLKEKI